MTACDTCERGLLRFVLSGHCSRCFGGLDWGFRSWGRKHLLRILVLFGLHLVSLSVRCCPDKCCKRLEPRHSWVSTDATTKIAAVQVICSCFAICCHGAQFAYCICMHSILVHFVGPLCCGCGSCRGENILFVHLHSRVDSLRSLRTLALLSGLQQCLNSNRFDRLVFTYFHMVSHIRKRCTPPFLTILSCFSWPFRIRAFDCFDMPTSLYFHSDNTFMSRGQNEVIRLLQKHRSKANFGPCIAGHELVA